MKATLVTIAAGVLLVLSGCSKEEDTADEPAANESSARDAAPGPLSETEPPSAPANDQE